MELGRTGVIDLCDKYTGEHCSRLKELIGEIIHHAKYTKFSTMSSNKVLIEAIRQLANAMTAEAAGIEIKGKNKWMTLIQNASKDN